MKRFIVIWFTLQLLLVYDYAAASNAPDLLWTGSYGGSNVEAGYAVTADATGGCAVAGNTASQGAGNEDMYLVRLSASGDTVWTRTFGTPGWDVARAITPASSGNGYVLAGISFQSPDGSDGAFYIVCCDSNGALVWSRLLRGAGGPSNAYSISNTNDGGYIVGGRSGGMFVVKLDSDGDSLWSRQYDVNGSPGYAYSVEQLSGLGYVIAGETFSVDSVHCTVVRTDSNGNAQWIKAYDLGVWNIAYSVHETGDGGFLVGGFTKDSAQSGQRDMLLVKTDSEGTPIWQSTFGAEGDDEARMVLPFADGSCVLTGYAGSWMNGGTCALAVDVNGNEMWHREFGGGQCHGATIASDNSLILVGDYASDLFVVKTEHITLPCPPTTIPFTDNFDSPQLDSCWTWIREDTSHWSLTERPGWMRIITQSGQDNWPSTPQCCLENKLLREVTDSDVRISCKLAFQPNAPFQQAGILVFKDEDNFIWGARSYGQDNAGQQCFIMAEQNGSSWDYHSLPVSDTLVYLRVDKTAETYAAYLSTDSVDWTYIGSVTSSLSANGVIKVGLYGATGPDSTVQNIPADFDYFRIDPLPGTTVCSDVSGVWDSAGSPYYVNCDVTVPSGQTLEIQPGVEVLFTGHYKFNIFGNLQAIGTEQDSIVFTRAFPTEESKWAGIRIVNATDTIRLDHCVVEYGNATGGWPDGYGGGLLALGSPIEITNTSFQHNTSFGGAAGARMTDCPYVRVQNSVFQFNSAGAEGAGGGLQLHGVHPNSVVNNCLFYANHSDGPGGGVEFDVPGQVSMHNCTIVENNSPWGGSGLAASGHNNVTNCIFWGNTGSPQILSWYVDYLTMTFSDVQGGYIGTGNIDADPIFEDALNGDFHLLDQSPCIDTGDPASPKDSDSTRTDMGAFPFVHTKLMTSPSQLDFGLIDLGTDSAMQIEFFNPTAAPISIPDVSYNTNAFIVDTVGLGGQIAPYSAYELNITFAPSTSGIYADTLDITTDQQVDSVIRIPISGEARVILPPVDSLVAQKGPLNGIRLDWAAVTHSITGQPVQDIVYVIYGSTSSDGPFVPFGYSTTNNYVHAFVLNTQPIYFYQVTADVSTGLAIHGNGLLPSDKNK